MSNLDKSINFTNFFRTYMLASPGNQDVVTKDESIARVNSNKDWLRKWINTLPTETKNNYLNEIQQRLNIKLK